MQKYTVSYSHKALNDLRSTFFYISNNLQSPENAVNQINRIQKAIRDLETFPNKHPLTQHSPWSLLDTHQMNLDNYLVVYIVNDKNLTVKITRIFYSKRNVEKV